MIKTTTKKQVQERINNLKKEIAFYRGVLTTISQLKKEKRVKCTFCGSTKVIKRGMRYNKSNTVQKMYCQDCHKKFSDTPILEYRMRNSRKKIMEALRLRKEGKTLAQIAKQIGGVSRQTILHWINYFQPPTEEVMAEFEQNNKFGKFKRKVKIKV